MSILTHWTTAICLGSSHEHLLLLRCHLWISLDFLLAGHLLMLSLATLLLLDNLHLSILSAHELRLVGLLVVLRNVLDRLVALLLLRLKELLLLLVLMALDVLLGVRVGLQVSKLLWCKLVWLHMALLRCKNLLLPKLLLLL